jgi:hypothetical protein
MFPTTFRDFSTTKKMLEVYIDAKRQREKAADLCEEFPKSEKNEYHR